MIVSKPDKISSQNGNNRSNKGYLIDAIMHHFIEYNLTDFLVTHIVKYKFLYTENVFVWDQPSL